MATLTKTELETAERLSQTVAAMARLLDEATGEIRMLNPELDERIRQATHETEASVEERAADRLRIAVEEAERTTRARVTEDLQTRFNQERALLNQELERIRQQAAESETEQKRLVSEYNRALTDSDDAAAIALERQIATATNRLRAELTARWDAERAHLVAERNRAQQRLAESAVDNERHLADSLESARLKFAEESDSLRLKFSEESDRQRQTLAEESDRLRQELQHVRDAYTVIEGERDRMREESERSLQYATDVEVRRAEIVRIENLIKEIDGVLNIPETELSVVIRKHAERGELESYVRGVRFGMPRQ